MVQYIDMVSRKPSEGFPKAFSKAFHRAPKRASGALRCATLYTSYDVCHDAMVNVKMMSIMMYAMVNVTMMAFISSVAYLVYITYLYVYIYIYIFIYIYIYMYFFPVPPHGHLMAPRAFAVLDG